MYELIFNSLTLRVHFLSAHPIASVRMSREGGYFCVQQRHKTCPIQAASSFWIVSVLCVHIFSCSFEATIFLNVLYKHQIWVPFYHCSKHCQIPYIL